MGNDKKKEQDIKPGYKTTEFWVTVVGSIIGLLMAFGILSQEASDALMGNIDRIAGGCLTLATTIAYIFTRGKAKSSLNTTSIPKVIIVKNANDNDIEELLK